MKASYVVNLQAKFSMFISCLKFQEQHASQIETMFTTHHQTEKNKENLLLGFKMLRITLLNFNEKY